MIYCTDADLLHWEPAIFEQPGFASQLLLAGTGALAGTTFTLAAGSLAAAHVEAGHVLVLTGAPAGSFPIVSINSATTLTASALHDKLYPPDAAPQPVSPGTAASIGFYVRTYGPQRRIVSDLLLATAGAGPASCRPAATVLNPEALRRPCALGTLQMIYSALAAVSPGDKSLPIRAELYQRLCQRAIEQTRVELDLDNDARADAVRRLGMVQLVRT